MSEAQLAMISEIAARYFCGWQPKPVGERRFPAFEKAVAQVVAVEEKK